MPSGVYERTEETRRKMRERLKGHKLSEKIKMKMSESRRGEGNSMFGRHHSKEAKLKMRKAKIGKKLPEETRKKMRESWRGRTGPNLGKKFSEEHKNKLREASQGKNNPMYGVHRFGEASPGWKGGKSFEPYGVEFNNKLKAQIRARDDNQCQLCKTYENGRTHPVHHKDYNKKNNDPSNLITLCDPCHSKTNGNREYWQNLFMAN